MKKNKTIYFIPVGGFHVMKSEYKTLKETMEQYGFKRSQINEWWSE